MIKLLSLGFGLIMGIALCVQGARADNAADCENTTNAAIKACTALIDAGDTPANLASDYYNRGLAYYHKGNRARSIKDYSKAIELNPSFEKAYNNRGSVYNSMGKFKAAIKDYDKAIEINPAYLFAYVNRGNAYDEHGKSARAILDYNKALTIDPNDPEAYFNRGLALERMGKKQNAIADFKKALSLQLRPGLAKVANKSLKRLKAK